MDTITYKQKKTKQLKNPDHGHNLKCAQVGMSFSFVFIDIL